MVQQDERNVPVSRKSPAIRSADFQLARALYGPGIRKGIGRPATNTLDAGEQLQMLANGEKLEKRIVLWAVANVASYLDLLQHNVMTLNVRTSTSLGDITG